MSEEHGIYSGVVDIARNGVDEVIRLRALNAELVEALRAASNYVDVLGGDSKGYRVALAKVEASNGS